MPAIMYKNVKYGNGSGGGSGGASALSDLTDVDLSNPSDGQVLKYDATNQKWVNSNESGGGGSGSIERLVYGADENTTSSTGLKLLTLTTDTNYAEYLSYNTSTKLFTVVKAFNAKIVSWVKNYQNSSGRPEGYLQINGVNVLAYIAQGTVANCRNGGMFARAMNIGDTIGVGAQGTGGFNQQFIKIYKADGICFQDALVDTFDDVGAGYTL